ncbi:MAG: hypothetical protein ACE5D8_05370 [Fidelibacterota bacterium]
MTPGFSSILILFLSLQQSPLVLEKYDCQDCHTPDSWRPLASQRKFDHDLTAFPLTNIHSTASCIQCHIGASVEDLHNFENADTRCSSCHMDIHYEAYGSDCQRCHDTKSWDFLNWQFSHDQTLFPLVGKHSNVSCNNCHGENAHFRIQNMTINCLVCHRDVFIDQVANAGHTNNEDCFLCHNTRAWFPSDMSHHDIFFPIYTGEHRGKWNGCNTECHYDINDYKVFSCGLEGEGGISCHAHRKRKMEDEHDNRSGYSYNSNKCYDCHPKGKED